MTLYTTVHEAIRSLYDAKQRTFLALLGITIGIASVIAMVSISKIAQEQALSEFKEMGTEILSISMGFSDPEEETRRPRINGMRLEDAMSLANHASTVHSATPFITQGMNFSYNGRDDYGNIIGVTQSYATMNRLKIETGRFISDLDEHRHYCVLGAQIVHRLQEMGMDNPIGSRLRIEDRPFTVIGILETSPSPGILPYQTDQAILIPLSTARRFFENSDITNITARMKPNVHHLNASREVLNYFKMREPKLKIEVNSAEEIIRQLEKQMRLFTLLSGAIGSIALLVGGVGVMNIMLTSVVERRAEIGIRRAVGARQRDIQQQFLIESVVLALIGGILGIILGIGFAWLIAYINDWTFMLSVMSIVLGFSVSTVVGIFFGFYPARQAAKLDPVVALR
ncbi:MAG: ABC transporter permease [Pseudomonadota bacterium]